MSTGVWIYNVMTELLDAFKIYVYVVLLKIFAHLRNENMHSSLQMWSSIYSIILTTGVLPHKLGLWNRSRLFNRNKAFQIRSALRSITVNFIHENCIHSNLLLSCKDNYKNPWIKKASLKSLLPLKKVALTVQSRKLNGCAMKYTNNALKVKHSNIMRNIYRHFFYVFNSRNNLNNVSPSYR